MRYSWFIVSCWFQGIYGSDLVMHQSLQILFPHKLLRNINYSSLCCTVLESARPSDSNQMTRKTRKSINSRCWWGCGDWSQFDPQWRRERKTVGWSWPWPLCDVRGLSKAVCRPLSQAGSQRSSMSARDGEALVPWPHSRGVVGSLCLCHIWHKINSASCLKHLGLSYRSWSQPSLYLPQLSSSNFWVHRQHPHVELMS